MTFRKWAITSAMAFYTASGSSAFAQQQISVNIGSSYATTNIWANAGKEAFQPEVDRILKAKGNKYTISWREGYGTGLFKFNESRAAVRDQVHRFELIRSACEQTRSGRCIFLPT